MIGRMSEGVDRKYMKKLGHVERKKERRLNKRRFKSDMKDSRY